MEKTDARSILGVNEDATDEEIEERFQELAIEKHPDQGGAKEELGKLVEARDNLIQGREIVLNNSQLDNTSRDIVKSLEGGVANEVAREETEKALNNIISRNTSRYRRLKQFSIFFGALLTGLTVLWRFVFPDQSTLLTLGVFSGTFQLMFITIAGMLGILSWGYHNKAKNIETLLNEAEEALDDKSNLVMVLNEIGVTRRDEFNKRYLEQSVKEWLSSRPDDSERRSGTGGYYNNAKNPLQPIYRYLGLMTPRLDFRMIAKTIGHTDFIRLLLRKALEKEIISERETIDEDGKLSIIYKVNKPE